jgi:hypothetical protein
MTKSERERLDAVAALGCIVCRNLGNFDSPAAIHHMRTGMGMSQRNDAWHALGLCLSHHQTGGIGVAFHASPRLWQARYGTETELLEQTNNLLKG